MFRIVVIIFLVVAAGDSGLRRTGGRPVHAADAILQDSKLANEAKPKTLTFTAEALKGRIFEKPIGANLFFRLVPEELGWTIFVGGKVSARNNFCAVVTPPYRGINALQIEGWHFRNADNSAPNEAGPKNVNAPQELKEFHFVLNETDYRSASDALQMLLWPYNYSKEQVAAAERAHAKVRKGSGKLTIRDLKLDTLNPGNQAGIDRMTFNVALVFP